MTKFKLFLLVLLSLVCFNSAVQTQPPFVPKSYIKHILKEHQCIQEALLAEAFGEPLEGIKAVMSVLYYRKQDGRFGQDYCDIIHAKFQFSYRNHLKKGQEYRLNSFKGPYKPSVQLKLDQVQSLAFEAAVEAFEPSLEEVLYYHNLSVKKSLSWNKPSKFVVQSGNHKFYRK